MSRIKKLAAQKELQKLKPKVRKKFSVETYCKDHIKQLEFINDESRRKVASCSRRAGKSQGVVGNMLKVAQETPEGLVYYIASSIGLAESIIWQPLLDLVLEYYDENEVYINHSKHLIRLPNKSVLKLAGCPNVASIRSFLGLAYSLCVVDESQDQNTYLLDLLLRKAIIPACIDFNGQIILIGTPALVQAGPFYEATFNKGLYKGWSNHNWTMQDNPHLWRKNNSSFDELLKKEMDRRGLEKPDSNIEREWFGKWVAGSEELVYQFNHEKNEYGKLKLDEKLEWKTAIGVDLGFKDEAAFVVVKYSYHHPTMYVIDEFKAPGLGVSQLMGKIGEMVSKHDPDIFIFDPAAGGTHFVEEINARFTASAMSAEKMEKLYHIKLFNDDMRNSKIKVKEGSLLPIEWNSLTYKIDSDGQPKENKAFQNHLSDAMLYVWRYIHNYCWTPLKKDVNVWDEGYEDEYAAKVGEEMRIEREDNEYSDSFDDVEMEW